LLSRIGRLLTIYKRGQGVWARGVAGLGILGMGTFAAVQTGNWMVGQRQMGELPLFGMKVPYYYGMGMYVPVVLMLVFVAAAVYACNSVRSADLLIQTEIEMRKVTWPTAREVAGATLVVIVVVLIMGVYLMGVDKICEWTVLKWLGLSTSG